MTVDSTDLATYLGTDVDQDRATLLIDLATNLAESIVKPLPDEADAVILSATARAYSNATGVTTQMAGPYQVTRPAGGVYLTKPERAALRRLNGGGGAFSVDLIGDYADRFKDPAS